MTAGPATGTGPDRPVTEPVALSWRPTPHAYRVFLLFTVAVLVAIAAGRPALIAVAAVPAAYLVLAVPGRAGRRAEVAVTVPARRCFENEPVAVGVELTPAASADYVGLSLRPGATLQVLGDGPELSRDGATQRLEALVAARRWGRRDLGTVPVRLLANHLLWGADASIELGELSVFPEPAAVRQVQVPDVRTQLFGDRTSVRVGAGVEFADVREFAAGDPITRINWPVTTRMGSLHVTDARAERALDAVLVIDAFNDVGAAGRRALDLSLRGATGLARSWLRTHDRIGVVALGSYLRWVRPDSSTRQFYRIADAMLDIVGRQSFVDPDLDRLSRAALPPGCLVVMFTPLTDARSVAAVAVLRGRGHRMVVVDVSSAAPDAQTGTELLARRVWTLDAATDRYRLGLLGVPIVDWDGRVPLDAALAPALRGLRSAR